MLTRIKDGASVTTSLPPNSSWPRTLVLLYCGLLPSFASSLAFWVASSLRLKNAALSCFTVVVSVRFLLSYSSLAASSLSRLPTCRPPLTLSALRKTPLNLSPSWSAATSTPTCCTKLTATCAQKNALATQIPSTLVTHPSPRQIWTTTAVLNHLEPPANLESLPRQVVLKAGNSAGTTRSELHLNKTLPTQWIRTLRWWACSNLSTPAPALASQLSSGSRNQSIRSPIMAASLMWEKIWPKPTSSLDGPLSSPVLSCYLSSSSNTPYGATKKVVFNTRMNLKQKCLKKMKNETWKIKASNNLDWEFKLLMF